MLTLAKERGKEKENIAGKIKEVLNEEGTGAFQYLGSQRDVSTKMRGIINHLLNSDKRKHYKYCPCCRYYDEGQNPSADQMGEFLEFIRQ